MLFSTEDVVVKEELEEKDATCTVSTYKSNKTCEGLRQRCKVDCVEQYRKDLP